MIRPRVALAALLVTAAAGLPAVAQFPVEWRGGSTNSDNWSSAGNFVPGRPLGPLPGDDIIFNNTSLNRLTTNVMDGDYTVTKLTVADPPGNVVVNFAAANTLTVTTGGVDLSAVSGRTLTFNPRFAIGADHSWVVAAGRTLTMAGQVSTGGAARNLTLNVSGGNGTTGTVVLGAANSFTAGSSITTRNGELRLDNAGALNGLTGGLILNPLAAPGGGTQYATVNLNAAGTYATVPVNLNSSSATLRSRLQSTVAGTTTLPGAVGLTGTGGVVELNVLNGSTLNVGGAVTGAGYDGTLQLGGASGNGFVNNTISLNANATVRKQDAGTWTLTQPAAATAWRNTRVAAGTLRAAAANVLPSNSRLTLGEGGSVGTVELAGDLTSQTVAGLDTGSDGTVDPAGNRIGIGDLAGPGPFRATLTYDDFQNLGASVFNGVIADSVGGSAVNKTVSLAKFAGNLSLGAANTYSGPTLIATAINVPIPSPSLRLISPGPFGNHGSFANSPTINLSRGSPTVQIPVLNVSALTGGANFDAASGRFAPAANQTLRGEGQVTGNVTVPATATIRGGLPTGTAAALTAAGLPGAVDSPTGALTVSGNLLIRGGTPGTGGGQLVVDLNGTNASGTQVSRIQVAGAGNVFELDNTAGPVVIPLVNDGGLVVDNPYTFTIASAEGGYRLTNGPTTTTVPTGTSYTYGTDFVLSSTRPDVFGFQNVTLTPNAANELVLSFTPVPEPATVLAVAAAGLAAARFGRRRILAG